MSIEERRSSQRASISIPAVEEYNAKEQEVTILDISEHGMHYQRPADKSKRAGQEVLLTFSLLERLQPIRALGWVVNEEPNGDYVSTRVTFMFLPEKDELTIRDFVYKEIA